MCYYWLAAAVMIGISVANLLLFKHPRFNSNAMRKCQSSFFGQERVNPGGLCNAKVQSAEKAAFIAAIVQGCLLVNINLILNNNLTFVIFNV